MRLQHLEGVQVALRHSPTAEDRVSPVPGKPRGDGKGHGNMSRCRDLWALCSSDCSFSPPCILRDRTGRDFRADSSRWGDLGKRQNYKLNRSPHFIIPTDR